AECVRAEADRRGECGLFRRRGRFARRKLGQALVPAAASGLPSIFLGEMPKPERKPLPVFLCETSHDEASCRLKWLASTCTAGMVGVCLIGVAIYASLNMDDGSGMVSSIKRASLAALQPIRTATLAKNGESASGEKGDRIQVTEAGFTTRQVIHDTVRERQGNRDSITITPYIRILAGLATQSPADVAQLLAVNPVILYCHSKPIGVNGETEDAYQAGNVKMVEVPGGGLTQSDGIELKPEDVRGLVAEAAELVAYAEDASGGDGNGQG